MKTKTTTEKNKANKQTKQKTLNKTNKIGLAQKK